jgi:aspartyl-tRNA(Asn)/glutamyl-tRNA(Gln) amidotransferase subunit A
VKQLSKDGFQPGVKAAFEDTIAKLVGQGAEIVEVDCPSFEYAIAAYYLILPAEASSNLAKFDSVRFGLRVTPEGNPTIERVMAATREAGFGPEVKRRIILGTYALSSGYYDAYYGSAQKVRTLIQRDLQAAFEKVDVIITPTAPTTAFKIGEKVDDPLAMYLNDIATIPANLAGIPGMSVPNGLASEDSLPSGVQILAPAMKDSQMYRVGAIIEQLYVAQWGSSLIHKAPKLEVL